MKLKALDTLHISALGPDPQLEGDEFSLNAVEGQNLIDRGQAVKVADEESDGADTGAKAEAAPLNKAEPAPLNKETAPPAPAKRVRKPAARKS